MFQVINKTPFQAATGLVFEQFGANLAAAAVKATFAIPSNNRLPDCLNIRLSRFFQTSVLIRRKIQASDIRQILSPGKNTDIGVNGCVYSKNNRPVTHVTASVRVERYYKEIEVMGDRIWKKKLLFPGTKISRPELFVKIPMTCDRLYGGHDKSKKGTVVVYEPNPFGTGFIVNKRTMGFKRLPNFENKKHMIKRWKDNPAPATFGFAAPSAKHRIKYGGTYDDKWKETHCPLYPADLDLRFFNCAQPELTADGFLKGGERVRLKNLSSRGTIEFRLPVYQPRFMFRVKEERIYHRPNLCTVVIEPEEEHFYMTWGCAIPIGNQPSHMHYLKVEIEEAEEVCNV